MVRAIIAGGFGFAVPLKYTMTGGLYIGMTPGTVKDSISAYVLYS